MIAIIDEKLIAKIIEKEIVHDLEELKNDYGLIPGLATVLVGDDPASKVYVGMKQKTCERLGIYSLGMNFDKNITQEKLTDCLSELNENPSIHGILIQLPLPKHIDTNSIIDSISPEKDVDGLHPENIGLLTANRSKFIPCTPYGVCELLIKSGVEISGQNVVVLGRSNLVGRPLSILLSQKSKFGDATVTLCHSNTKNLTEHCRRADILIVAIGQRNFVTGDMIKPGAVIIDVGIHRMPESEGGGLCGDVNFDEAKEIASKITPVPGGVGPMTIIMLMRNVVDSAMRFANIQVSLNAN